MQARGVSRTFLEVSIVAASLGMFWACCSFLWPLTILWCALNSALWTLVMVFYRQFDPLSWFFVSIIVTWLIFYLYIRITVHRRAGF